MYAITTYLWKEWRDQRMTVFGIVAVQFMVCALLVTFLQHTIIGSTGMVSAVTLGSLAVSLVVFGPELIGGETRTGTLGFLSRMPAGLHLAFGAKTLFLVLTLVGLSTSGYLISAAFHLLFRPDWVGSVPPILFRDWIVPAAVTAGLLLMAVSSWLPRSILTVPATGMLAVLILLPCYLVLGQNTSLASYLRMERCFSYGPPLALAILWVSFTRGRRAGGGPGSSAWRGLAGCLLAALPLWSWVGYWMHEWSTPRPHKEIRIMNSFMGEGGKLAFLNTSRRYNWPFISLVVDVETGEWRQIGELNDVFASPGLTERFGLDRFGEYQLIIQLQERGLQPRPYTLGPFSYVETATGETIPLDTSNKERARAAMRNRTPARTPEGQRVWMLNRNLEVSTDGGGFESLPWDRRDAVLGVIGYGLLVHRDGRLAVYDLTRRRLFTEPRFDPNCCWILGSRWLVGDRERTSPRVLGRTITNWRLLDPESGAVEVAPGMRDGDLVVALLDDGRVIVEAADESDTQRMVTVDVHRGVRIPLTVEGLPDSRWSVFEYSPMRSPDDRRLFVMSIAGKTLHLTSLAPGSDTLTRPVPMDHVLGCPDATTALIIGPGRKTLQRVDLVTGQTEIVFPKPR